MHPEAGNAGILFTSLTIEFENNVPYLNDMEHPK